MTNSTANDPAKKPERPRRDSVLGDRLRQLCHSDSIRLVRLDTAPPSSGNRRQCEVPKLFARSRVATPRLGSGCCIHLGNPTSQVCPCRLRKGEIGCVGNGGQARYTDEVTFHVFCEIERTPHLRRAYDELLDDYDQGGLNRQIGRSIRATLNAVSGERMSVVDTCEIVANVRRLDGIDSDWSWGD